MEYCIYSSLVLYIDLMARWDIGAIENLPSYMQIVFRNLWEIIKDIEQEMALRGRYGGVQPTIDEVRKLLLGIKTR